MASTLRNIHIDISQQKLHLHEGSELIRTFLISSSKYGIGCERDSLKTPLGQHIIRAKIGEDEPVRRLFSYRRPTTEIIDELDGDEDYILSRILWLSGKEPGINRLGQVDTMRRFIYIHGTHQEGALGTPSSRGCIRMGNEDIVWLFDQVDTGTEVVIQKHSQ